MTEYRRSRIWLRLYCYKRKKAAAQGGQLLFHIVS